MKRGVAYVAVLVLFALSIVALLQVGGRLPGPGGLVVGAWPAAPSTDTVLDTFLVSARQNLADPLSRLILQLIVITLTARIVGQLFVGLGQPSVVGEMAGGIVIGPSGLGLVAPEVFAFVFPPNSLETLRVLSQVGVCLFMFTVGMELDVSNLGRRAHAAVVVSHVSIVVPFVLGVVLALFLYGSLAAPGSTFTSFALFMGIVMSITAFPVLARILQERDLTRTPLGSTAITCAAVDDVTAWLLLAAIVAISRAASVGAVGLNLLLVFAFILVMVRGVRRGLPRWLGPARLARDEPSTSTLALVVCVLLGGALCTEVIGIHALFGTFLAGVVMPDSSVFRHKLRVRVGDLTAALLLPLFFAYTGLRTQIGLIADLNGWLLCLLIIAVATLGKLGGTAVSARLAGMGWPEALQLGALMNTRGLMELIALNVGYDMGILPPRIFTMLVIMALTTTLLTGPLLTLFRERDAKVASLAARP